MKPTRRHVFACVAAVLAVSSLCAGPASAETWPARPIRLVVPFPPGGGTDIVARRLAEHLREELGQTVIVDNKAGASGNIGADSVAKSAPDGYTLMMTAAPFAIAPAVFKQLPFDPVKDFTPVTLLATVPLLIVTRADSPLASVKDIVALARKDPGGVTYATFGIGSPPHLVGESISQIAGVKMTHVPYKGGQAALPDLLSGQLAFAILDVVSMAPLIKAGRLKALAITGTKRAPALPAVPTLIEAGVPFDQVGWYAIFGPAGVPAAIVDRINATTNRVMALPDMQKLLADNGCIAVAPPTAKGWATAFQNDVKVWGQAARTAGATIE